MKQFFARHFPTQVDHYPTLAQLVRYQKDFSRQALSKFDAADEQVQLRNHAVVCKCEMLLNMHKFHEALNTHPRAFSEFVAKCENPNISISNESLLLMKRLYGLIDSNNLVNPIARNVLLSSVATDEQGKLMLCHPVDFHVAPTYAPRLRSSL